MAARASTEAFSKNGGDGSYSCNCNSSFQVVPSPFLLSAHLGCSVGPNTFIAVKNIIECVEQKCHQSQGLDSQVIDFQVFFNDHVANDFNTLFKSLPRDRRYLLCSRCPRFLLWSLILHFVNSSYSLQWLSKVPKEVVDKNSPAWNKGRIYYSSAPNEVIQAYSTQFSRDMGSFLKARAEELVCGGLMALLIPCVPVGTPPSQSPLRAVVDLLGESLLDMADMGLVSEDKVDSFNFPKYNPTPPELEYLIESNGCFTIVKMEPTVRAPVADGSAPTIQVFMLHLRAAWEPLIKQHFGSEIIEELFVQFTKKVAKSSTLSESSYKTVLELFVLLQRKTG
ncbi:hypothetical protein RJ639_010372 [Escallonia herrerae]|uniref:S-adenosylmethionine-dependent methyltransferase n=1 Tax=Escallonia herrerae TaxID=1293975 RepID=A0AA89APZ1_9ASTE|nr:hypothetical protein RJ639_010372 [Escallonia herrerae]